MRFIAGFTIVGFGVGEITRRLRCSETFLFDVEKSFGKVKSHGLFWWLAVSFKEP